MFLLQRHFANDPALQQRVLMRFIEKQLAVEDPLRTYYELELAINPSISVSLNRCAISSTYYTQVSERFDSANGYYNTVLVSHRCTLPFTQQQH